MSPTKGGKKQKKDEPVYEFYMPPPNYSTGEKLKRFFYDPDEKAIFGRTCGSWAKIGAFYLLFYAGLAGFFSVMLVVFYQTLDNFNPKWTLDDSLIGTNPGLGFRPMPKDSHVESTLIWFRHGAKGTWLDWETRLQEFMKPYEEGQQYGPTFHPCTWTNPPPKDKVCAMDIKKFGNCTKEKHFGYDIGTPCILIKLNRIHSWIPDPYMSPDELPDNAPPGLVDRVDQLPRHNETLVYVTCEGENPADRENIGPIEYHPWQGFPTYFFPYRNTPGYLSPIVMVQFLKVTTGVLINIECKAWAKNIKHNRMERRGSVHFELLMD